MNELSQEYRVTAKLAIYIDVVIDGRKQIYDVETAQKLQHELTLALNQWETQARVSTDHGGNSQSQSPRTPRDRSQQNVDVKPIAADEVLRRGA